MIKVIIFRLHWLLGLTAGTVLVVVALSGAVLSLKEPIMATLNDSLTVASEARTPLSLNDVLRAAELQLPGKRIVSLTRFSDPNRALRISAVPDVSQAGTQSSRPKRERHYVDPFTGALMKHNAAPESFFTVAEQLHRNLLAGSSGRAVVGISTIALVILAMSGLYLRWPRVHGWRIWFSMMWNLRGRAFWLRLHSVVGTWVLLAYLLIALTGLYFAYPAYRTVLANAIGAQLPSRAPAMLDVPSSAPLDLDRVWQTFAAQNVDFQSADLSLPEKPSMAVEIRYLAEDAPHERALNRLVVHPETGTLIRHDIYRQQPLANRVLASMYALHAGSFFGVGGLAIMMLASMCMPVFAVSGWVLYVRRRARSRVHDAALPSQPIADAK